ncbi:MAG: HD domain-containing protein [Giesbergeria sp.]|uniref:HD-GYP domain-containing protein n=1 Tax=Giesbergeria sp. TaxID=2818473 RepID=UPI00262C2286|nr:HD domain-containing phosphohydrolase [Giesbergeria sp.]MDD2608574.1 HD domain-containing protein [Giesbergeria sp.]
MRDLSAIDSTPPSVFPTELPHSPHYLRAVTDLAHQRAVVAHEAIYAESGIKLVEKGMRLDGRLYDRLVQHTLREPVDSHLVAEDAVDHTVLTAVARQLIQRDGLLPLLMQDMGPGFEQFWPTLAQIPLPGSIMFKLTVMREESLHLFEHGLHMAILAWWLAVRRGLSDADSVAVVAAALLHDMGVLHLDPAWRDRAQKIVGAQRKNLVAHPIIGMLMVRGSGGYPDAVATAVLEHHERMDGSGYPRSLSGADISPLGQILLLCEVVTTFYDKYAHDSPGLHLATVLRLNHRKFPADLCHHVMALVRQSLPPEPTLVLLGANVQRYLQIVTLAFERWEQLCSLVAIAPAGPQAFVQERLQGLSKTLSEAGLHPQCAPKLLELLQGDAQATAELCFLGREALWQLQSIVHSCLRRWPEVAERQNPADRFLADWCDWLLAQQR